MHINIISIIIITIARVRDENENNKKSVHECRTPSLSGFFFVIMQNFKIMRYNKYHMWGRITFE